MPTVSLTPEIIGNLWGLPITNTLLTSWLAMAALILVAAVFKGTLRYMPGKFQNAIEMVVESVLDFMTNIANDRKTAERFFPVVGTIFLFVITANWMGILPGVGSIGFFVPHLSAVSAQTGAGETEFIPLFRSVHSDLTMTLALALLVVIMSHIVGLFSIGAKHHIGKFISFKSPVAFFVGILEAISEIAKIISFSFRLFGNVFAGEVLLIIIAFLVPYVAPVPFLGLELFVGFIQALIFAVLAMMFFTSATREAH